MKTYAEVIDKMIYDLTGNIAEQERNAIAAKKEIDALRKNSPKRGTWGNMLADLNTTILENKEKLAQMERFKNEISAIEDVETRIAALCAERESIYERIGNKANLIFCVLRSERNN